MLHFNSFMSIALKAFSVSPIISLYMGIMPGEGRALNVVNPWITTVVIVFGIIVAIVGVIAYLRMYKKSAWSATRPEHDEPPLLELFSSKKQTSAGLNSTDDDKK
jgi:hypothetical protein